MNELKSKLKEKINVETLMVISLGGLDMVVGECDSEKIHDKDFTVKNPKRLSRVMQATPQGVTVNIVLNDMELMGETGTAVVTPQSYYFVEKQSDETKINVYNLYLGYFEQKKLQRAREVGIVAPSSGIQRG